MKLKIGLVVFALLLITVLSVHAQGTLPCDGTDPDADCPLDTWVVVLVIASGIFATFRLYRRHKDSLSLAK